MPIVLVRVGLFGLLFCLAGFTNARGTGICLGGNRYCRSSRHDFATASGGRVRLAFLKIPFGDGS